MNLQLSEKWFPRTNKPLTSGVIGACLHCGTGDPSIFDGFRQDYGQRDFIWVSIKCKGCGLSIEYAKHPCTQWSDEEDKIKITEPLTKEDRERVRAMVATLWNGRHAKPPLVSFGGWKNGTSFTGGRPPEWTD